MGRKTATLIFLLPALMAGLISVPLFLGAQNLKSKLDLLPGVSLIESVHRTMTYSWDIKNQQQLADYYYGLFMSSEGKFDYKLNLSAQKNILNNPEYTIQDKIIHQYSNVLSYQLGISKQFEYGITVSPNVLATFSESKYDSQNVYPKRYQNHLAANLTINIPLLQNSGKAATTASINANQLLFEANLKKLYHTVTQSIYATASAYWNYAAMNEQCVQIREVIDNEYDYLDQMRKLASADLIPSADTLNVSANIGSYLIMLSDYYQQLLSARTNLGQVMGLDAKSIDSLGFPTDIFPLIDLKSIDLTALRSTNPDQVLNQRGDYQALLQTVESGKCNLLLANQAVKPKLDLNVTGGYTGLVASDQYNFTAPYSQNIPGPSVWVSLDFQLPVSNKSGKGVVVQNKALLEQSNNQAQMLANSILSEVQLSADKLNFLIGEYQDQMETLDYLAAIYENEKRKYIDQESTLINVNSTKTQLLNARLNLISIMGRYYSEVVYFRFITGTLLNPGKPDNTIELDQLITLPKH
ncbi:MAG: TolC family protein [Bacteroidales bacterium]|nr:TolC family protein [Bacteroidales bacterium]